MSPRQVQDRNYKRLAFVLVVLCYVGAAVYGWRGADDHSLHHAMALLLIAAAAYALGGLAGFLFGIPKTLQMDAGGNGNGKDSTSARRHGWQTNTNLEQVSDWLTKILIGVGLTELRQLPGRLQDTGDYIVRSLGYNFSPAIIDAMLIVFLIAGFVTAYLVTKFDLGTAIDAQDGLLDALASAIVKNPNDRETVESYMLSSLYMPAPDGFSRVIQTGEAFLSQEGHPRAEDGNVFAYLTCAYGQKYAYEIQTKSSGPDHDLTRERVLTNAAQAVERVPGWRLKFRQFANPPTGSKDNDLASLKDDKDLRTLLGMDQPSKAAIVPPDMTRPG